MADRKGKLCDDCLARGDEKIIGTRSCLIMYMVVGTYEQGEIENDATLPRFAWQIYAKYDVRKDALAVRPVPRAELCGTCWVERLKAEGALDLLTHDEHYEESKKEWEKSHPEAVAEKKELAAEALEARRRLAAEELEDQKRIARLVAEQEDARLKLARDAASEPTKETEDGEHP